MNWTLELPLAYGLGWALLHFLWQGALIALLLTAALPVLRAPQTRYVAACSAMIAMVAAFVTTWAWSIPQSIAPLIPHVSRAGSAGSNTAPAALIVESSAFEIALPWVVTLWAAGAVLIGMYHVGGWISVQRMRRVGVCAAPAVWQDRLRRLACRMGVSQPLLLLESSLANGPIVVGLLRPAILFPAGLLSGLPVSQLEAILLHELAHVRRLDYLVNLMQTLIESLLFYHPAVWWVSKLIRDERESCCDDAVLAVRGNARDYAAALVTLEERRCFGREPAAAATGGILVNRIRRLLRQPEEPRAMAGIVLSMGLLLAAFCMIAVAQQAGSAAQAADENRVDTPHARWLNEDVVYIISPEEREAFERLTAEEERQRFIEQFWGRRDPTPDSAVNELKVEHYRRIEYANERWTAGIAGWKSDRGRLYVLYGPPDEIESHPSGGTNKRPGFSSSHPFEMWRYRQIDGLGEDVWATFEDKQRTGDFPLISGPLAMKP